MKRIHLFEFEDFSWFPAWIRKYMTRLIIVMHRLLGTPDELASLINRALRETNSYSIIDLCSGSGGPLPEVHRILKEKYGFSDLKLTFTDLYPDQDFARRINSKGNPEITCQTEPVDAINISPDKKGLRTMVASMHHMKPDVARGILRNAKENRQPICIYEISDNSFPTLLWWVALPLNFLTCFIITPLARPVSLRHLFFTYVIPVIPFFFAWDGAVSNVRTYTLGDLDELLEGLKSDDYKWEKGKIEGKAKKLYLLGIPVSDQEQRS